MHLYTQLQPSCIPNWLLIPYHSTVITAAGTSLKAVMTTTALATGPVMSPWCGQHYAQASAMAPCLENHYICTDTVLFVLKHYMVLIQPCTINTFNNSDVYLSRADPRGYVHACAALWRVAEAGHMHEGRA